MTKKAFHVMTEIYCQIFHLMPKCYERVNVLI